MIVVNYILRSALITLAFASVLAGTAYGMVLPVSEFTLDNGMKVIVIEDHRAPVVLHAVQYNVGGVDEQTGKTGLAHFFEHLMFKGTKNEMPSQILKPPSITSGQRLPCSKS
jgi:zinc protease